MFDWSLPNDAQLLLLAFLFVQKLYRMPRLNLVWLPSRQETYPKNLLCALLFWFGDHTQKCSRNHVIQGVYPVCYLQSKFPPVFSTPIFVSSHIWQCLGPPKNSVQGLLGNQVVPDR